VKVSIVIPCHNHGQYLASAIKSAISQTYRDFEIIVVDDGSTDNTSDVLDGYADNARVTIIRQEKKGPAAARNIAIEKAQGEYILSLDADDLIDRKMLDETVPLLDDDPELGLVYTQWRMFGDVTKTVMPIEYDFMVLAYHGNFLPGCALFRKKAWEDAGGYNPNMIYGGDSWDLYLGMGEKGWFGELVSKPLLMFRVHTDSMQSLSAKHEKDIQKLIVDNHPELYKKRIPETEWIGLYEKINDEDRYPLEYATVPAMKSLVEKNIDYLNKQEKPKVSVIIPCYNYGHYVEEAVSSVLRQTYKNFEIIIVNDGSTDFTKDILKKYEDHPMITVVNQENQGVATARNTAIKRSAGEFIMTLDADDLIDEEMLAATVPLLDANTKLGFIYTAWMFFGELERPILPIDYHLMVLTYHSNYITCCTLFRKKAWEEAGGYNPNTVYGYEDWDLWLSMAEKEWYGELLPEPLFLYRDHRQSRRDITDRNEEKAVDRIIKNHPELYNAPITEQEYFEFREMILKEKRFPLENMAMPNFYFKMIRNVQFSDPDRKPNVSIVIPCYNYANYVDEAIGSALGQLYRDFEVIVVNDGSTDGTKEALEKYQDNPRVTVINQKNQGLAASRNNGIRKARGEYILPLDADDMMHEVMLESTVPVLENNPNLGVVTTDILWFGDEKKRIAPLEYDFNRLKTENHLNYCSLFRKKAWEDAGGYNTNMVYGSEDWDFWISMGEKGWYGKVVHKPLFFYRKHGTSMFDGTQEHWDDVLEQIRKNHPALYETSNELL
jgi:glycosyltransferase involved in cell wall biosynthesis